MLDKKLDKTGTILMHKGEISIDGFDADGCMCREVAILAMLWGIGEMQRELTEMIFDPEGGNVGVDLPPSVHIALGLPDPLDFWPKPTTKSE